MEKSLQAITEALDVPMGQREWVVVRSGHNEITVLF